MYSKKQIYEANVRIAAFNQAEFEFEEDLDIILLLLLLDEKKKRKNSHIMYKQRTYEGVHNVLIDRYLVDDDTKFREYFRLSPHLFQTILAGIKMDIKGIPTNWNPKPIRRNYASH